MTKIDKMLDELDRFWYKMVPSQHRDSLNACQMGLLDMKA